MDILTYMPVMIASAQPSIMRFLPSQQIKFLWGTHNRILVRANDILGHVVTAAAAK